MKEVQWLKSEFPVKIAIMFSLSAFNYLVFETDSKTLNKNIILVTEFSGLTMDWLEKDIVFVNTIHDMNMSCWDISNVNSISPVTRIAIDLDPKIGTTWKSNKI